MADRIRATIGLTAWMAFVAVAVAGLHSLQPALPIQAIWSSEAGLELALGALLRVIGLTVGWWLLVSTVACLLIRVMRVPAVRIDRATLPLVRRLADRISARSLVRVLATPLPLLDLVTPGYVPIPAFGAESQPAVSEAPAVEARVIVTRPQEAVEVIIVSGDNMWKLSERRLSEVLGRPPTDAETGPYWRRVVQANRDRIRSGDPDLIFPGEILILPSV
jgi:hypothetical protein